MFCSARIRRWRMRWPTAPPRVCRRSRSRRRPRNFLGLLVRMCGRPPDPGDRHARRLQHHLPGAGRRTRRSASSHWNTNRVMRRWPPRTCAGPGSPTGSRSSSARRWKPCRGCPGEFDFVFIDADKENNSAYVQWAIDLGHPGTVIVVDNIVRNGRILRPGRRRPCRRSAVRDDAGDDGPPSATGHRRHPDGGRQGLGRFRAGPGDLGLGAGSASRRFCRTPLL